MSDLLVVASKVKGAVKPMRVSAEALEKLSGTVLTVLSRAADIANAEGRKTISAQHVTEARSKP